MRRNFEVFRLALYCGVTFEKQARDIWGMPHNPTSYVCYS